MVTPDQLLQPNTHAQCFASATRQQHHIISSTQLRNARSAIHPCQSTSDAGQFASSAALQSRSLGALHYSAPGRSDTLLATYRGRSLLWRACLAALLTAQQARRISCSALAAFSVT